MFLLCSLCYRTTLRGSSEKMRQPLKRQKRYNLTNQGLVTQHTHLNKLLFASIDIGERSQAMSLKRTTGITTAILGGLFALPALAADGPDLSKVDRRIAREPQYVAKQPLYGLYVFGPEAKTRAWAVLDKSKEESPVYDVLYFDRQATGDLTGAGKRIVGKVSGQQVTFDIGSFTVAKTGDTHTDLTISCRGDGTVFLSMKWKGTHRVGGGYAEDPGPYTVFAAKPADAPVLWPGADGQLAFQRWMWKTLNIGQAGDVRVFLGHQGHGRNTFCGLSQDFLPPKAKVLATLIYTDGQGKQNRVLCELPGRC